MHLSTTKEIFLLLSNSCTVFYSTVTQRLGSYDVWNLNLGKQNIKVTCCAQTNHPDSGLIQWFLTFYSPWPPFKYLMWPQTMAMDSQDLNYNISSRLYRFPVIILCAPPPGIPGQQVENRRSNIMAWSYNIFF